MFGNDDLKGLQGGLQLEPATTDEWMVISFEENFILLGDRYAGFIDQFTVDQHLARHDQRAGPLSACCEAPAENGQIEALFIGSRHETEYRNLTVSSSMGTH